MTAQEVLKQLKALGNESTRKTLVRHGADPDKCYGVKIGEVEVDHGDTACRTPFAPDYIAKVEKMGRVGKKKKTIKR